MAPVQSHQVQGRRLAGQPLGQGSWEGLGFRASRGLRSTYFWDCCGDDSASGAGGNGAEELTAARIGDTLMLIRDFLGHAIFSASRA
jgi:hypothetical protein